MKNIIHFFKFIWLIFWLFLIIPNSFFWIYLAHNGPDFISHFGWIGPPSGELLHIPIAFAIIVTSVICLFIAVEPSDRKYS